LSTEATQKLGGEAGDKTLGWRRSAERSNPRIEIVLGGAGKLKTRRPGVNPKGERGEFKPYEL
jgi:hypothetical protein